MKKFFFMLLVCQIAVWNVAHASEAAGGATTNEEVGSPEIVVSGTKDAEIIPYAKAYTYVEKFQSMSNVDKVLLAAFVTPRKPGLALSDISLSVSGDSTNIPVKILENGIAEVPWSRAAVADDAQFVLNQKKGHVRLELKAVMKLQGQELGYEEFAEMVGQLSGVEHAFMGFVQRSLTPAYNTGIFEFPPGVNASVTVRSKNGDKVHKADEKGVVLIAVEKKLMEQDVSLVFSALPVRATANYIPHL